MNDPGVGKASREDRKKERLKAWKKPKTKAKIKSMRAERIRTILPDYQ